eukprot:gene10847-22636_t
MAGRLQKIEIGSRVITGAGNKKGIVSFIGDTQFASGEWIGVSLETPDGKNDGSVGNVKYFQCQPNHGLFVKRAQVKFDREEVIGESRDSKIAALREKRKAREAVSKDISEDAHVEDDAESVTGGGGGVSHGHVV